jgi:hypothetical protein
VLEEEETAVGTGGRRGDGHLRGEPENTERPAEHRRSP